MKTPTLHPHRTARTALAALFALAVLVCACQPTLAADDQPAISAAEAAAPAAETAAEWTIPSLWWIAPAAAVLALVFAWIFFRQVKAANEGDERMKEIAAHVTAGAYAYLKRQYKVVAVFFIVVSAALGLMGLVGAQHPLVFIAFLTGGFFSGLCGFLGMKTATMASNRTTQGAKESLNRGLVVAFRAGAVMGLVVVGFGLIDITGWFLLLTKGIPHFFPEFHMSLVEVTVVMLTFGMGASSQALFARVGGGIFTKAADVGADLVGKVEAGIPEDDPRNPATIADNVGDNVGDVAGMGADLYESYCGSILSTAALGVAAVASIGGSLQTQVTMLAAPMILAGVGIILSILGIYLVRTKEGANMGQLMGALGRGVNGSSVLIIAAAGGVCYYLFHVLGVENEVAGLQWWGIWASIVSGLVAGMIIGKFTEYYTSYEYGPTKAVAKQSETGAATVIISGLAEGMKSTWASLATIIIAIMAAYSFAGGFENMTLGLYGVGIAAVGMLATLGITLATDAYGPIADNAGGNAEMTGQDAEVRERTDKLDSLGNTTAATGKGFAIGSAALTALALLAAYVEEVRVGQNREGDQAPIVAREGSTTRMGLIADADKRVESGQSLLTPDVVIDVVYNDFNKGLVGYREPGKTKSTVAGGMFITDLVMTDHRSLFMTEVGNNRKFMKFRRGNDGRFYSVEKAIYYTEKDEYGHWKTVDADGNSLAKEVTLIFVPSPTASLSDYMAYYRVNLMNPKVLCGIFAGVLLVFLFSAMTMNAVGRAAGAMVNEVRRQFREIPGIMEGTGQPDYARCVAISTAGAQKEMIIPSLLALIVPIAVGLLLDVAGVMGLLAGGLGSGFAMAIFMANAGGAWDNAKKYIETGAMGGKGSDDHKATVVGDTVGDPFKDTSGPSLNILIKLMSMVSVVFAGLIVKYAPTIGQWLHIGDY